jgi:hypothetical protein
MTEWQRVMNLVRSESKRSWPTVLRQANIYVDSIRKNVSRDKPVTLPSFEPCIFRTQVKSALELNCTVMLLLSALQLKELLKLGDSGGHHCKHQLPTRKRKGV